MSRVGNKEPESVSASRRHGVIAVFAVAAIIAHLVLRFGFHSPAGNYPLFAALFFGGVPLLYELLLKLFQRQFGSDLLAGISIVTSVLLARPSRITPCATLLRFSRRWPSGCRPWPT